MKFSFCKRLVGFGGIGPDEITSKPAMSVRQTVSSKVAFPERKFERPLYGSFDLNVPDKTELRVSASMSSVLRPTLANEMAILTDVVDLPSPASTELTAITFI